MTLSETPILETRALNWGDEAACAAHAAALALQPELANAFVTLQGDLGSGKTTFVRHLLRALGVQGRIKSPTYAVMEPYELPGLTVSHFDFYRFTDAREWHDAGFRDVFMQPGLKLAEWPQNVASALPLADLTLTLATRSEHSRGATLNAYSPAGVALLRAWP
jgi:tRNA threonylcarbamoyladenosine biosynthesis protein TsaE